MNIDIGLANRALLNLGHEPLTEADKTGDNVVWQLTKEYYLQTFLEALTEIPWTGGRKRARLMRTRMAHLQDKYRFYYDFPYDCARPIELQGNGYYQVEDRFICTNVENAELLYVSNGRILVETNLFTGGNAKTREWDCLEYMSGGWCDTKPDWTIHGGNARDMALGIPVPVNNEDYPEYQIPRLEAKFYEYVERMLSAKYAVKLSDDPNMHMAFLQEAVLVKDDAENVSLATSGAMREPKGYWVDQMGFDKVD